MNCSLRQVKKQKKSWLLRDNMWLLDVADERCMRGFDPLEHACKKMCKPVLHAAPGKRERALKSCLTLNREDDRRARRSTARYVRNGTWGELRGQFWHPSAYASLGAGCVRAPARRGALREKNEAACSTMVRSVTHCTTTRATVKLHCGCSRTAVGEH